MARDRRDNFLPVDHIQVMTQARATQAATARRRDGASPSGMDHAGREWHAGQLITSNPADNRIVLVILWLLVEYFPRNRC
jgi:hypothetical protein